MTNFMDANLDSKLPGEMLRSMLEERGWTQDSLAAIINVSRTTINNIIMGRSGISPEMAVALAAAFQNDPIYWLKANAHYQVSLIKQDDDIGLRRRLYDTAPIADMQRRGWIKDVNGTKELEVELNNFFGVHVLTEEIGFPIATRRKTSLTDLNYSERAWCFKARELASNVVVASFNPNKLHRAEKDLRTLAAYPKEAFHLHRVLSEYGIRFVVVEPLPGAKIDGAAFWINEEPVIALSIRYDRIDSFWFTLMHEFAHIRYADAISIDTNLTDNQKGIVVKDNENQIEQRANETAANSLIPREEIGYFIQRRGERYSRKNIIQFAHRIKMHPGIIVGQLQHMKAIGFSTFRDLLVKIRDIVIETALTDGWKQSTTTN